MPGIFERRARVPCTSGGRWKRRCRRHFDACGFTETVVIIWQVRQLQHFVHDRASLPIAHPLRLK